MNKTELVKAIAAKAGISQKDAGAALAAALETIQAAVVAGENVQIAGFGTFARKERAARVGHNPQTKAPVEIPACKYPAFKAGKSFKDLFK